MAHHVRLVQRGGMHHCIHALHTLRDEITIGDRSQARRKRRTLDVEANGLAAGALQSPHERLAQVARAAGDQNSHCLPLLGP